MESNTHPWLQRAKKHAGWLMVLGVVEIVVGILAILSPLIAGLSIALIVGIAFLVGGGARIFEAFRADSFGAGALTFLWGVLIVCAGFYLVQRPGLALVSLTLVVAFVLFTDGIMRIIISFHMKPVQGWGWMLVGGLLSVALALMVWAQFPVSAAWLVGTLAGVSLLSNGMTVFSVAGAARKVAGVAAAV
jgi:uncharacterized membrane protein HdeD (DUF308 family)